jgi:hypothetical protein
MFGGRSSPTNSLYSNDCGGLYRLLAISRAYRLRVTLSGDRDAPEPTALDRTCCSILPSLSSSSLSDSVSAVSPSARSLVVGFSVDRAASRNLFPAVDAQGAALLMSADRTSGHRHYVAKNAIPMQVFAGPIPFKSAYPSTRTTRLGLRDSQLH